MRCKKKNHLEQSTSTGIGNFQFTKCHNKESFLEEETYFSTSLKRPADPEKTEKGKLIVYVVCFITQTVYNVFIFNYLDVVEFYKLRLSFSISCQVVNF